MLNRRKFLAAGLLAGAPRFPLVGKQFLVNVADFLPGRGMITLDVFNAAIAALPSSMAKLQIPAGSYVFEGDNPAILTFKGFTRLEIIGTGSHLLFTSFDSGLNFVNCRDVTVRGLTIDWVSPPFTQGVTRSVSPNKRTMVIESDGPITPVMLLPIRTISLWDSRQNLLVWDVLSGKDVLETIKAGPKLLRVNLSSLAPLRKGDAVVLRHDVRGRHAISFKGCTNVHVEDVCVWSGPSMALSAEYCRNIEIRRLSVTPKPSSGRLMSTNADGLHLDPSHGRTIVDDCNFSAMGDDAINATGHYLRMIVATDGRYATCLPWGRPCRKRLKLFLHRETLSPSLIDRQLGFWIARR